MSEQSAYLTFDQLVELVPPHTLIAVRRMMADHRDAIFAAPASAHNHQAWPGGYADHVTEIANIALVQYAALSALRPLPFTVGDVILVVLLHRFDRVFRYGPDKHYLAAGTVKQRHGLRDMLIRRYKISLSAQHVNALRYAEGEHDEHRRDRRAASPLAAFLQSSTLISSRVWPQFPAAANDLWASGRQHAA